MAVKEFWYADIDDYVEMADQYDNPKTVKMHEVQNVEEENMRLFRAVTYLRTSIIGFQVKKHKDKIEELEKKCEAHSHKKGIILEVGRLE